MDSSQGIFNGIFVPFNSFLARKIKKNSHSLRLVAENLKKTPIIYYYWLMKESTICVGVKPSRLSHEVCGHEFGKP